MELKDLALLQQYDTDVDLEPAVKYLLNSCLNKNFQGISAILQSNNYTSDFLFIPNSTYKLMYTLLCFSMDEYIEYIYTECSIEQLERSEEFIELFNWFFNNEKQDYIGNFVFICEQVRISKKLILKLLIKITKTRFNIT